MVTFLPPLPSPLLSSPLLPSAPLLQDSSSLHSDLSSSAGSLVGNNNITEKNVLMMMIRNMMIKNTLWMIVKNICSASLDASYVTELLKAYLVAGCLEH